MEQVDVSSGMLQDGMVNPRNASLTASKAKLLLPKPSAYPYYSASQSKTCNGYIPNDSTLSRYSIVAAS